MDTIDESIEMEYPEATFGASCKVTFPKDKAGQKHQHKNGGTKPQRHHSNNNGPIATHSNASFKPDIPKDSDPAAELTQSTEETLASFMAIRDKQLQAKTVEFLDDPAAYFQHIEQDDNMKVALSCGLFWGIVILTVILMFTMNPPM